MRASGALLLGCAIALFGSAAHATDDADLFDLAKVALHEGRAQDAVATFEALADRGVVDPVASYDRGLAYAMRVRVGAEQPGDLGRAAHGFEEARELTRDRKLADDASRALTVVRSEVARRRARAGARVDVDPGRSFASAVAHLLGERTWAWLAVSSSAILAFGLALRWLGRGGRLRVGGGIAAGVAAPSLALAVGMTLAARHDRLSLREAIVVSANARPTDERGIAIPGATALPEGARVEVIENRDASAHVRFGALDAWVAAGSLRPLARAD